MKYRAVIFDVDGTLLDTTDGVIESAVYAAKSFGYPELPYETMLKFVGPPIQESFIKHYGFSVSDAQKAANVFRSYYKDNALLKATPYKGIFDVCKFLQKSNVKQAVATYKREDYALTLLHHFSFDAYLDVIHGADNNNVLTKSDIIKLCISDMGYKENECVLIGDTLHDANGAAESGIDFIAVTYGFGFKRNESISVNHIAVADKPEDLIHFIA